MSVKNWCMAGVAHMFYSKKKSHPTIGVVIGGDIVGVVIISILASSILSVRHCPDIIKGKLRNRTNVLGNP